jgi:hypothetical protein
MRRNGQPKKKKANRNQTAVITAGRSAMVLPVGRLPVRVAGTHLLRASKTIYPPMVKLDFPIEPLAFVMVAGVVSASQAIDANALTTLATDFYALFQEYCLVGARFEIRVTDVVNPGGIILVYIDEKVATAPTLAQAAARPHVEMLVSNTESPNRYEIDWVASDFLDLQWGSTAAAGASPVIPSYIKFFSSVAGTFTTNTTTCQVIITGSLSFCFRGYAD